MSGLPIPYTKQQAVETYFMEHRAKVLDLAAFLDRVDRANGDAEAANNDPRMRAMRDAIALLLEDGPGRAKRIQELYSDMSDTVIEAAPGKGAIGVDPAYQSKAATQSVSKNMGGTQ